MTERVAATVAGTSLPPHAQQLLSDPDVILVRWPAEADLRERAAAQGHGCLLRVAEGERPPLEWDHLEDWLREPIALAELDVRRARLRRRLIARLPVWIDDDGLLRRGSRWVALAPMEVRLLEPLLAMKDEVVSRRSLHADVYEGEIARDMRLVDSTLRRLRRRVRPFGVMIHTVRGTGFLLEVGEPPD